MVNLKPPLGFPHIATKSGKKLAIVGMQRTVLVMPISD
jgi:hypothetical protein